MNSGQHIEGPRELPSPVISEDIAQIYYYCSQCLGTKKVSEYLLLLMKFFHSSLGLRVEVVCIAVLFYLL